MRAPDDTTGTHDESRCQLIREITHSRYSHVGIVLERDGQRVVWEDLGPVGPTPLGRWVRRGRGGAVAVYRMEDGLRARLPRISREIAAFRGLPYDADYQWDDERIYCSELIAKAVRRATRTDYFPPHPSSPGSFGNHLLLIRKMSRGRLTEDTPLVSPADLAHSPHLHRLVDELQ